MAPTEATVRSLAMDELNEVAALAVCYDNLKGPRDKDLLGTARALRYLKSLPKYRSNAALAMATGVSGEMVREFLVLLKLPDQIQTHLEHGRLTLDQGRRLWQLGRERADVLQETAEAMIGMKTIDSRSLVDYILRHPEATVSEAKKRVLESKTVVVQEYHVVAIVSEVEYQSLQREADGRGQRVDQLVTEVVRQWIKVSQDG